MIFRPAAAEDCRVVYELICDMESKSLPWDAFERIFRAQLESDQYDCMIFESEQGVIGMINLRYEDQLHHAARIAEIMEFVVNSEYRGRGYGHDILACAVQQAESRGCIQIEVACNQLRTDTHRFYLREGMKNYHYKFSKSLTGDDDSGNVLGR